MGQLIRAFVQFGKRKGFGSADDGRLRRMPRYLIFEELRK